MRPPLGFAGEGETSQCIVLFCIVSVIGVAGGGGISKAFLNPGEEWMERGRIDGYTRIE